MLRAVRTIPRLRSCSARVVACPELHLLKDCISSSAARLQAATGSDAPKPADLAETLADIFQKLDAEPPSGLKVDFSRPPDAQAGVIPPSQPTTPPAKQFQYLPDSPFARKGKFRDPPPPPPQGDKAAGAGEKAGGKGKLDWSTVGSPLGTGEYSKFESQQPEPWTTLKYLPLYPRKVRRWVLDAKSRLGRYTDTGRWHVDIADDLHATVRDSALTTIAGKVIIEREMERRKQLAATHFEPPADLVGHFRFGIKPEELDAVKAPQKLRDLLSMTNASPHEVRQFRIAQASKKIGRHEYDTGSSEAQIAILSEKINALNEHFKTHRQDKHGKYRMQIIISRRHRLMKYLRDKKPEAYFRVLKEYGLKDIV